MDCARSSRMVGNSTLILEVFEYRFDHSRMTANDRPLRGSWQTFHKRIAEGLPVIQPNGPSIGRDRAENEAVSFNISHCPYSLGQTYRSSLLE
jgi:hypothetical protein